ncbi:MAG: TlpA family protein disulfide reductase [Thiogranum sp.]|nr:TlpA family protein disulfide reductase [Thiogranum sp.]
MKTKRRVTGLFALALLGSAVWLWLPRGGLTHSPDVSVTNLQGEQLRLADLKGRPLLVNFWATSCSACITEITHLTELHDEYAPQGLRIIGIAMPYDPPNRVIALSEARQIPYDIALDVQGKATAAFGDIRLTPSSFLIAPDGRIVLHQVGDLDAEKVRSLILDMLARMDYPRQQLARY